MKKENGFESHESYGMMQFSRVHGGKEALFGSSIRHSDRVLCRLSEGSVKRNLGEDWYSDDELLFEVEMSQSQYAELISSMNVGCGVPVTIRYRRENGKLKKCEEPPFVAKGEQHQQEFVEAINQTYQNARELVDDAAKILAKKNLTKADREAIMSSLRGIENDIGSNLEFSLEQFRRQMDRTVMEAKAEVEAYAQHKMQMLAQVGTEKAVEEKKKNERMP